MSSVAHLFYFTLLHSMLASARINLHLTDWPDGIDNSTAAISHDCLNLPASITGELDPHQIIPLCLAEWPSTWTIEPNHHDQKLSFVELKTRNITSEQLQQWSAPIDAVERYQLYLQTQVTSQTAMQYFYNCSTPRFGPLCQYSLDVDQLGSSSLSEMIYEFYRREYEPMTVTCYTHLQCDLGSKAMCLHWTDICDGYIDCLNNAADEANCWQLEIGQCADDEYRCHNGQCIPKVYFNDQRTAFECLDRSDVHNGAEARPIPQKGEPTFTQEDSSCSMRILFMGTKLTASCVMQRDPLHLQTLFSDRPSSLSAMCWLLFKCFLAITPLWDPVCIQHCPQLECREQINQTCPELLLIPHGAIAFGHIQIAFERTTLVKSTGYVPPAYLCYNEQLCGGFHSNATLLTFDNMTCRRPADFPVSYTFGGRMSWIDYYVGPLYLDLHRCNTIIYKDPAICRSSTMHQCLHSAKCISIFRLCDGVQDCDLNDDEQCGWNDPVCSSARSAHLFNCTNTQTCISLKRVGDDHCDCGIDDYGLCDDEVSERDRIRTHISFSTTCDGFLELKPIIIDGHNETDETHCEHWQCNNLYTRCDGFWNCLDGTDELQCLSPPLLPCPAKHHVCVLPATTQLTCLPISRVSDGHVDCLGGIDEPRLCRATDHHPTEKNFHCINDTAQPCISSSHLCDKKKHCLHGDDEQFCEHNLNITWYERICNEKFRPFRSDIQNLLCGRPNDKNKPSTVHFALDRPAKNRTRAKRQLPPVNPSVRYPPNRCHRGLPLQVWLDIDRSLTELACLCPPSYYGDACQYDSQRVALTLRFKAFSDSRRTLFAVVIYLVDDTDQRVIHSHQQLTYIYLQHCQIKFNFYLLYATRPKNPNHHFSIHLDLHEKITLAYRGSFAIPIDHPFLPVHRVALHLDIPRTRDTIDLCSDLNCVHGRCVRYAQHSNTDQRRTGFCQCHPGWSGKLCTLRHTCTCSSDSLCLGVAANNRSICVCPLGTSGPSCLLANSVCQSNASPPCLNGGQCLPTDDNMITRNPFMCLCRKGFSGERCENVDTALVVSFDDGVALPASILVHFIELHHHAPPENGSTFKNVPPSRRAIAVQWSRPFHIVFVEFVSGDYHLVLVQKTFTPASSVSRTVKPVDRCKPLRELFNDTIVRSHPIQRIKYYHLPCRQPESLPCFYDDSHFCLCTDHEGQRVANCFEFNTTIRHDCAGQSNCENNAQCLQDKPNCPQSSICVCPKCFYGTRCQFSSHSFSLSLDAILGDQIQPHVRLSQQSSQVKVSVALAVLIVLTGLVSGVLSLITFSNEATRTVGSGIYLLGSSITTLLSVTMLALKVAILIATQMALSQNRSFLRLQCTSVDFLLRVCLVTDKWLNACVSLERSWATIQGVRFDKKRSKRITRYVIPVLVLLVIGSTVHDPVHRRLLDDDDVDEKRIWCIVSYSPGFQQFDRAIEMVHVLVPFVINVVSSIIITIITVRLRMTTDRHRTQQTILREQLQRHRHLIVAPVLLMILTLPRLVIAFVSGCLTSPGGSWLLLAGYFISFIPSMLCFVVFVLPSRLYKDQFQQTVRRYGETIMRQTVTIE